MKQTRYEWVYPYAGVLAAWVGFVFNPTLWARKMVATVVTGWLLVSGVGGTFNFFADVPVLGQVFFFGESAKTPWAFHAGAAAIVCGLLVYDLKQWQASG